MNKRLALLNLASVLLVIVINYLSQSIRINETTIGEISNSYYNLFTPAGYAFAIWGLIFLALLGYGIYQVKSAFSNKDSSKLIAQTGYWFILANLLNCTWVFVFSFEYTGLSVVVMLGILLSLSQIIRKTQMNVTKISKSGMYFGWLPIGIYSGWIAVATIANISAYLSKLEWNGGLFSEIQWTIAMLVIATLLNIFMAWKRNILEFGLVGIWAVFAIYMRHSGNIDSIATTALICCGILLLVIISKFFKNRSTSRYVSPKEQH